jgi:NitT/TauT family transport system ATP-binding protein
MAVLTTPGPTDVVATGRATWKLQIEDARIEYPTEHGAVVACEGVSFSVADGEFIALIGRSGCGKTSILYAIDGLLPLAAGRVLIDGHEVTGPGHDRAMVFQSSSLLPWRTILRNVAYGAELAGVKRQVAEVRARELVKLVGLDGFEKHRPHELSGGMQQRVNLGRALAVEPGLLLLDEPFSALDAQTRELMQTELLRIRKERRDLGRSTTMIFVTHDIVEAAFLADRVIVFSSRPGRVRAEVPIDVPRPRDVKVKESPQFQQRVAELRALIDEEA